MEMFTFADTKYFTVCERGGLNDNRLILTYFDYHGINAESQPITRWESKDNEWTYEHFHGKMNNHSKVGIWKYQHDQELVFTYFDLATDPKGRFEEVKARINIGALYGVGDIQLKISYLWENKPNVYWLVALSNKYDHKEKCKNKDGVVNNNYVIDATLAKDQASIRETKFSFDKDGETFSYNDQLTDCFGLGGVSVFHTFRHKEGQVLETPVYYVHNESEEIIYRDTWKSTCYADNFFYPAWDGSTMVQTYHLNGDCEDCIFTMKKMVDPKEISMHFLLHLHEDFDDDLLQDAVELLHG